MSDDRELTPADIALAALGDLVAEALSRMPRTLRRKVKRRVLQRRWRVMQPAGVPEGEWHVTVPWGPDHVFAVVLVPDALMEDLERSGALRDVIDDRADSPAEHTEG